MELRQGGGAQGRGEAHAAEGAALEGHHSCHVLLPRQHVGHTVGTHVLVPHALRRRAWGLGLQSRLPLRCRCKHRAHAGRERHTRFETERGAPQDCMSSTHTWSGGELGASASASRTDVPGWAAVLSTATAYTENGDTGGARGKGASAQERAGIMLRAPGSQMSG